MAKRKRRTFTKEFKAQAVRIVRESGKSVGTVARDLGRLRETRGLEPASLERERRARARQEAGSQGTGAGDP